MILSVSAIVKDAHIEKIIFLYVLSVRLIFILVTGFEPYARLSDATWIVNLADLAASGDFNFDIGRFIAAPFYPVLLAVFKLIFGDIWEYTAVGFQTLIASWAGVYLFRMGKLVFKDSVIGFYTAVIYGFFPTTLWWTHTLSTETLFQSVLIMCLYFLVKSVKESNGFDLIRSALLFIICYLTKSHILLFAPFITLFIFLQPLSFPLKIRWVALYTVIALSASLPFGLYNWYRHEVYVISSNGGPFHFYTGNHEFGYRTIVTPPSQKDAEFKELLNFNVGYFNGSRYDSIMALPQKVKQKLFFRESISWIRTNPVRFIELKAYNTFFFLMPGVSWRHYPFTFWLGSLLISLPVYLFACCGMISVGKTDFRSHSWMFFLFISMLLFSVVFYTQNRFRTVTLEPMYFLYSVYGMKRLVINCQK